MMHKFASVNADLTRFIHKYMHNRNEKENAHTAVTCI